jgi:hypothetical protein
MENNYQLGQRICIKNIRYHTMADAQIVRITKHYLFCCKGQNQLPDNNNYFYMVIMLKVLNSAIWMICMMIQLSNYTKTIHIN